ncbi:antA/AntB antirepressor family protein [Lachnospiraceae bacterium 38-14]
MRITNKNTTKPRKGKVYESESFKDGQFTEEELKQYGLSDNEIVTILEYQSLLPILQENENNTISAKELHNQLKVSRDFSTWIKQQIEDLELVENIDYFIDSPLKGSGLVDYQLKLSDAKEIAMLAGSKGGRTSEELKKMSKLVRKYFIAIEKAFKNRTNWNTNRKNTLINCKELRGALITKREELLNGVPEWITNGNLYSIEFSLLNTVILGMSATQYRKEHNISSNEQIRNYFSEDQLDDVERLERYDAQLIISQEIYSYEERKQILQTEYDRVKNRKTKWV